MLITRRRVLKGIGTVGMLGAYGLWPVPGLRHAAFGADYNSSILIVLHLRGGCDGLNFISPATDPDFIAARLSDLRVAADGDNAGYALANAPAPDIDFRLHNAAGGLAELYKNGHLAFIHACGLTNATRSHFVATDMIEHGVASDADLARATSGWITRALQSSSSSSSSSLRAISANSVMSNDLGEQAMAMAIPTLDGGLAPVGGSEIGNAIWKLYADQSGEVAAAGREAMTLMGAIDAQLPRDPSNHVIAYQPGTDVNYNSAGDFQRPLKTIAQLIKMEVGLEVATLDFGDWDTHENQPGRFRNNVQRLSDGIAAFWNDMSAYHDRIVLVAITEFGRRLRSNKSNGTDHGRSSVMTVLGGKVAGGKCYGRWPGLKSEQLDEGVDLAVTTDYRQILSEILYQRSRNTANADWFPHFKSGLPLGLFNKTTVR